MRYHDNEAKFEFDDDEAEIMERGALEKSMTDQAQAMIEERIVEKALKSVVGDMRLELFARDIEAATATLEGALLAQATAFDKGGRQ